MHSGLLDQILCYYHFIKMNALMAGWWIFTLCVSCLSQKFENGKIIGVSEGRTCEALEDPEHGHYACHVAQGQERCQLVCPPGYIVPITITPQDELMDVNLRGFYVCEEVVGGVTWSPKILFDCVEKIEPSLLMLYFGIDFKKPCTSNTGVSAIQQSLSTKVTQSSSEVMKACAFHRVQCKVAIFAACAGSIVADMEVSIPFTDENIDQFPAFRDEMDREVPLHGPNGFLKLVGQASRTEVSMSSFFTDCPKGTRLESDFTCRGCSKGYFLDQSRAACSPCPPGTYQDQTLQVSCKQCPEGAIPGQDGLMEQKHCLYSSTWDHHTSLKTLTLALSLIVAVGTVVIFYRGTVTNEVRPHTKERDLLYESEASFAPGITWNKRGFDMRTNWPARKIDELLELKNKVLTFAKLPVELPIKTDAAKSALASARMRLTMKANMMKKAALLKQTESSQEVSKQTPQGDSKPSYFSITPVVSFFSDQKLSLRKQDQEEPEKEKPKEETKQPKLDKDAHASDQGQAPTAEERRPSQPAKTEGEKASAIMSDQPGSSSDRPSYESTGQQKPASSIVGKGSGSVSVPKPPESIANSELTSQSKSSSVKKGSIRKSVLHPGSSHN